MIPSKIYSLSYKKRYLGCTPKPAKALDEPFLNTKIFGFVKRTDAELVKRKIKHDASNFIEQIDEQHYLVRIEPSFAIGAVKAKPIRRQMVQVEEMDPYVAVSELFVNNLELKIIDEIQQVKSDIILHSNYKIEIEADGEVIVQNMQHIYETFETNEDVDK